MAVVKIEGLAAIDELQQEGYSFADKAEGALKIAVMNLMPLKEQTERQLLRRLSAASALVDVTFLTTESYRSTHVSAEHLEKFYTTFSKIRGEKWDGMIITGAPVENMEFEEVTYWPELAELIEWSKTNVRSVLFICWGAQAGLYYHYGVPKRPLPQKQFGIFPHEVTAQCPLSTNMASFVTPHSRHTYTPKEEILKHSQLQIVAESAMAGVYLVLDEVNRWIFVTGHSEYEANTLDQEYRRDLAKGLNIQMPYQYYPEDDDTKAPVNVWNEHSETLFNNWIKYYVSED